MLLEESGRESEVDRVESLFLQFTRLPFKKIRERIFRKLVSY